MDGYVKVNLPSFASLLLRTSTPNLADPDPEAPPAVVCRAATGIITRRHGQAWLVTAGHVVTGRHSGTGEMNSTAVVPRHVIIQLPHSDHWSSRYWIREPLYSPKDQPLWKQHPLGPQVDVVALPLPSKVRFSTEQGVLTSEDAMFETRTVVRPEVLWDGIIDKPLAPISLDVADELSVVGYPFGLTGGESLAIWTRGFIATELQFDHDELPMYLLDARTRGGQSGSPVVFFSRSGMFPTGDGIAAGLGSNLLRFMGIYSGRVNQESDLGRVFRTSAVLEVLDAGVSPEANF